MEFVNGTKIKEYLLTLELSIDSAVTIEKLKTNYRMLAKKYHPDNQETANEELFKKVQRLCTLLLAHHYKSSPHSHH